MSVSNSKVFKGLSGKTVAERCELLWELLCSQFPREHLGKIEGFLSILAGHSSPSLIHPLQKVHPRLYVPELSSKPWYESKRVAATKQIESAYPLIREELHQILTKGNSLRPYGEISEIFKKAKLQEQHKEVQTSPVSSKNDNTALRAFYFYQASGIVKENCERCPKTAKILASLSIAREALFSVLAPRARLAVHSDELNFVVTCHLGIIIPQKCGIRVGEETKTWSEGKCLVFDSSYIHEVWNNDNRERCILLVDVWHPDLTAIEIQALSYIMKYVEELVMEASI